VADDKRIAEIFLDGRSVISRSPQVEHERKVAIYDLLEENYFDPEGGFEGPFTLHLGIRENRLVFDVRSQADKPLVEFTLALASLRSIVRDYFLICDSYYEAIKSASPSKIEAIDMGRRGLHDEGAEILKERLAGKADIDKRTARRLFTLICVLHIRS
jgi:uncharacterized protein (UPF0262 family)